MNFDFRLVHETAQGAGAAFRLREGSQLVGRDKNCEILLMDKSVSREHARVTVNNGSVHVEDLQSRNGTFIDNHQIGTGTLIPEQGIMFGTLSFRLKAVPTEEPSDDDTYYPTEGQLEKAKKNPAFALLTDGQMRVFEELLTGATEIQIAQRLNLAKTTVHNHAKSIYATLGVHSRAELIRRFLDALRDT